MRNRKCYINKTVVEVTFRTEEGLPFVATPYVRLILEGILARAQSLYSVKICHAIFMANHAHFIIVVEDPEDVKAFFGYLKRESSAAINRLLGRAKHTVWCEGFDSPIILDAEKVLDRIVYAYTNPQDAGLVEKIEDYPNFSTWEAFCSGGAEFKRRRIPRCTIPKLPNRTQSIAEQQLLADQLQENAHEEHVLVIEPDAWMECFSEYTDCDPEEINQEIERRIRAFEAEQSKKRTFPVVGAHALQLQNIRKAYTPKKRGKRMICLGSTKDIRLPFIKWFKEYAAEGRRIYEGWSTSRWLAKLPPGLFAPGGNLHSNLNRAFVPLIAY